MALVFVSCGQATDEERSTAATVKKWLKGKGFDVFVALETQSLSDLNEGTIGHLRRADFFLFIDFKREDLHRDGTQVGSRGSLFTHQELAISYLLDFKEAVFLKHKDVELRGIAQFMMANATEFSEFDGVQAIVEKLVTERGWSPEYSRNLVVGNVRFHKEVLRYGDHTTGSNGRCDLVAFAEIENRRPDTAATHTVAKLSKLAKYENGSWLELHLNDQSRLKWAGYLQGYNCLILPSSKLGASKESFSLFAIDAENPSRINLHSQLDVPRQPIIDSVGKYRLTYHVYSIELPLLTFTVELCLAPSLQDSAVALVNE